MLRSWGAIFSARFPEGTAVHPSVLDVVEREIGRLVEIDLRYTGGVRVGYSVYGETRRAATSDSLAVSAQILTLLNLPPDAVDEHMIIKREVEMLEMPERHLTLLPDLPEE